MSNYLLHNLGYYENPDKINFRYIVLDTLKQYGICQHLKDYSTDHWGLTDVNKWLKSTKGLEDTIVNSKKRLKEYRKQLKQIENGDETLIQQEYQKKLSNAQSLKNSENSYYIDEANRADKCAEEYYKYLSQFNLPDNCELSDRLWEEFTLSSYGKLKKEFIDRLKSYIKWQEDEIKNAKKNIKYVESCNQIIKSVFNELDLMEKRMGVENGKMD